MALYQKFPVKVEGTTRGIVLRGSNGSANLVAIYNLITFFYGSDYGHPSPVSEKTLKGIISNALHQAFEQLEDISASQIKEVKKVLAKISTDFSLKPCMRAHLDFENNAAYMLCRILGLKVIHTWVLNPEINNYEIIKDLSHAELVEYCHDKEDQDGHLKDLLNDSANQLTSYGFNSLANELKEDSLSLIFCRNQLDIIHKHDGVLYLLVTDEDLHNQMPTALWMVFEEHQENNIFFNASYAPVEGQPCEQRAQDFCTNLTRKCEKNAARNRLKKAKRKAKSLQSQKGESNGASLESSEPSKTAANEGEVQVDTKSSVDEDKGAETVVSHPIEDLGFTGSSHEENKIKEESQEGFEASMCQVSCKEGVDVAEGLGFIGSSKEQDKSEESQEVVDASVCQVSSKKGVDVAEGVAYDFLMFLMDFKDNVCSEPFFKGIVAAFSSHAPLFYVPYEFIMEYNEGLALKIQDNYSRISEDLKESVVRYLSLNEVTFTDPVLKIVGLPEPKSVRSFLDFVDSIVLHEHYQVYGMDPEALPSYDSRRMCLGYLNVIVAKFRTGRCWDGEWSEDNMKVKNKGLEFAIDCEKDYELTAERGYHDLLKFSTTVLERLRFNGRLPPYFDSFSADIMLISRCFGNPVKWDRFLELISYPLALKPPLVRASFICNIYLAANANSSGTPPRYAPFYSRTDCIDWRKSATENELLKEVYDYLETRRSKRLNHILDEWSVSHWHVFKFSRHFIQHVLQYTKGQNLIQKVKDISIVDILLSRMIWIALAKSVTFLVLNCGVDGLFSSAWRHYVGSDSVDMPNLNLEDATTSDMVQELVDTISEVKKTAYVCSEISVFSKPKNLSVIIGDADLTELKLQLNNSGFKCNLAGDGCLQCGSIMLSKHTKQTNGRTFLLVEGPYSPKYNSIFAFVTEQLCL